MTASTEGINGGLLGSMRKAERLHTIDVRLTVRCRHGERYFSCDYMLTTHRQNCYNYGVRRVKIKRFSHGAGGIEFE